MSTVGRTHIILAAQGWPSASCSHHSKGVNMQERNVPPGSLNGRWDWPPEMETGRTSPFTHSRSSTGSLHKEMAPQGYLATQWQPTPVLLPGKSHGWRSLIGCSPWGRWESDMTERLPFLFSLSCIGEGNGNPLQCSCLENPTDGRAWWAAVYGVAQSRTWLKRLSSSRDISFVTPEEGELPASSEWRPGTLLNAL